LITDNEQSQNFDDSLETIACLWPLKKDAQEIRCNKIKDISLKGVYCYSDIKLSIGTVCDMELHVTKSNSKIVLFFKVKIIYTDESGMAVRFEEMDLDSLFSLKDVFGCKTLNP
jgi:hypothetical protein